MPPYFPCLPCYRRPFICPPTRCPDPLPSPTSRAVLRTLRNRVLHSPAVGCQPCQPCPVSASFWVIFSATVQAPGRNVAACTAIMALHLAPHSTTTNRSATRQPLSSTS